MPHARRDVNKPAARSQERSLIYNLERIGEHDAARLRAPARKRADLRNALWNYQHVGGSTWYQANYRLLIFRDDKVTLAMSPLQIVIACQQASFRIVPQPIVERIFQGLTRAREQDDVVVDAEGWATFRTLGGRLAVYLPGRCADALEHDRELHAIVREIAEDTEELRA